MITYVNGDLLDSKDPLIVHGCNAQGVMGSGVALAIKNNYPSVYKTYRWAYEEQNLVPGDVVYANTKHDNGKDQWVANLISQKYYGGDRKKYVSYDAIDTGLIDVAKFCTSAGIYQIGMPKIGAGLGGGKWEVIEAIINHRLFGFDVAVYWL